MPVNTGAYTSPRHGPSAVRGCSRHRVDRQDELCKDVTQDKRWVTIEIQRTGSGVRVHASCGHREVALDAADVGRPDVPRFAAEALEYLGLDVMLSGAA